MRTHVTLRHRFVLPLILTLLVASCARDAAIEKTLLTVLPPGYVTGSFMVSRDGNAYAFIEDRDGGQRVVASSGTGPVYAKCSRLSFTKTNRLFYWGRETPGAGAEARFTLVADGKPFPTEFIAAGEVVFSEDGARWLAVGAGPPRAIGELGEISLLVEGVETTRQRDMSVPTFSPDGQHIAYLAKIDDRVRLFIDGIERQGFEAPSAECGVSAVAAAPHPDVPLRHVVRYLNDGTLLVMTRDADGWGVYRDGLRIASYPAANLDRADPNCASAAVLAPRSLSKAERAPVAFWWERVAGDADLWRVVRDARPVDATTCSEPWRHQPPEASADGRRVVYACSESQKEGGANVTLLKGADRYGPYQDVWGIAPTKDGAHVAYGASSRELSRPWSVYVDGTPIFAHVSSVWRPRVSDDGTTLAWEAKRDDESRGIFGINDRVVGSFDDVLWGPEFQSGTRAVWILRRGRKISRISVPFSAAARERPVRVVTVAPGA